MTRKYLAPYGYHLDFKWVFAMRIAFIGLAAGLAVMSSASQAVVAVNPDQLVYSFYGTCSDCTLNSLPGEPIATLVLDGEYISGAPIEVADIVSFSYVGSNLVDAYSATGDAAVIFDPEALTDISVASGAMTPGAGPKDFAITFSDNYRFESTSSGSWFTCAPGANGPYSGTCTYLINNDFGAGSWIAPIPEPTSWGLMALGLAGLGLRRRQA